MGSCEVCISTLQGELQDEEDNSNDEFAHCQHEHTPSFQPLKLIPKVLLYVCTTGHSGGDFADLSVDIKAQACIKRMDSS